MTRDEFKDKYASRKYLGDGLYAQFDGFSIILIAPRERVDHWVGLEPSIFEALLVYRKQLYKDADSITEDNKND